MPIGLGPRLQRSQKPKRTLPERAFRPDGPVAALSALGIAILWIPRNAHALRQTHLHENDAYSDLLNTL